MNMAKANITKFGLKRSLCATQMPRQNLMNINNQDMEMARALVARANIRVASGSALIPRQNQDTMDMTNQNVEMARALVARANIFCTLVHSNALIKKNVK